MKREEQILNNINRSLVHIAMLPSVECYAAKVRREIAICIKKEKEGTVHKMNAKYLIKRKYFKVPTYMSLFRVLGS